MNDETQIGLRWTRRLFAALWFAGCALFPIFILTSIGFASDDDTFGPYALFALPTFLAAVSGYFLGAQILDRSKPRNGLSSAGFGALTSLSSFVVYATCISIIAGFGNSLTFDPQRIAFLFFVYFVGAMITVGWFAVGVGAIGGSLLFKYSTMAQERRGPVAIVSALLFLFGLFVPILLNLISADQRRQEKRQQFEKMKESQKAGSNE